VVVSVSDVRPGVLPVRNQPSDQELLYTAADKLTAAYRELGDAADCLRGLGKPAALRAIGEAKEAINRAKEEIDA
jgi:hypothetical protein